MLTFDAYRDGESVAEIDLAGAYVFGQDSIPVRADLTVDGGRISCVKRVPGACGLTLLWEAGSAGRLLLSTTRLPEREKRYNLNVELARGQMMRLAQKLEDWGLFDYADAKPLNEEFEQVRKVFVEALKCDVPPEAARLADRALEGGVTLGERMALFHADIFLTRRKGPAAARGGFGCAVDLAAAEDGCQELLRDAFDFIYLPLPWKQVEPSEGVFQYAQADAWVNWAARARKRIHAGPLISFQPAHLPQWLYVFEHDYDNLRDLMYEHVQRVVRRYEKQVKTWSVTCGIHAYNNLKLSFERLMEITRMSCLLVKKLVPKSQVMIELAMPWGEYYARNQRTIPPLLYADMAVQSGVKFDAFGVQFFFGAPVEGYYVRDLMQISSMLDEFVLLGKPVHVTAFQSPSDTTPDSADAWEGQAPPEAAGRWHTPWSQRLQAEWIQAFCRIALSKPFVESVCWRDLTDHAGHYMPHGGLCCTPAEPKLAYKELKLFRCSLAAPAARAAADQSQPAPQAQQIPEDPKKT